MALPKQVERDLVELDAYEQQLKAPAVSEETPPVVTDVADPATVAEPVKAEAKAAPVVEEENSPTWAQKYRTLEGKYAVEVPRLHQQNKELATQLRAMQEQIDALKRPTPTAEPPVALVTAEDVTEFGGPLLDVQRRVATEVAQSVVAPLQEELAKRNQEIVELKTAQTKTGGDVATLSFTQQLARDIPDFEAVNSDPKWIAWLDEVDPLTTEPRRTYAEFVYTNGHVTKLKAVVDLFKSTTGATQKDTSREAELQQRKTELERQITPSRTTSQNTTEAPANTKVYTEVEAADGFNRIRQMNTAGKYDEANKLEAELTLAYMEGRVRG